MSAMSSPTRRSLLAISAAAGAYSLLPGRLAAKGERLTIIEAELAEARAAGLAEIGRASCRERVCLLV